MSSAAPHGRPAQFRDRDMALLAATLVAGVWLQSPLVAVGAVALGVVTGRARFVPWLVVAAVGGSTLGRDAWADVRPDRLGPYSGWATIVDDPRPVGSGLRATIEIEGERFEAFAFGSVRRRLERRQAGERVDIVATRGSLTTDFPRRAQARHVVGEITIERIWSDSPGAPLARASNRLRGQLRSGADAVMSPADAALFTGLVIGDDTRQPTQMIDRFRAAGLSHLTAVSGQNVALVLAVVGLGLRRLPTWWRLGATLAVIAWFAVITRLEPSVLRASCMAGLSAAAFALGRERSAVRLLYVTVMILVAVDPLLVWSVGFWLSTGATFGVVAIAPLIERRLAGPAWWRNGLAVTLGAQIGVVVPSWLVFQRMPVLGIVANLLAVPVAGIVMLYGLPAALVASLLPAPAAQLVMAPCTVGTRWVALVAECAAGLEPTGAAAVVVWAIQGVVLTSVIRRRPRDAVDCAATGLP